ncbi:ABC-2 family transporter protein [Shimazuella sp. AN120528]|uniref:ABC transporter permease n=1 Tax=Shimazuella soli TaxID=1892854 RepID=UPI001F107FFF|nr:ABC-2 family transporter protein [Shimazuella soli]MCH5586559.1 ABC-2 family transporter protein [Shimazuella soli]
MAMYKEVIRIRFLMMLAYRVNYYSGIIIYSINIGAYVFLWHAVYGGKPSIQGFTAIQMATYIAISWMARAFYYNNLDREIAEEIRDGSVAIQIIRPYSYLMVKVFQGFGEGLFRLFLFSIPGMIIVSFIYPIQLTTNPLVWTQFLISLLFGFIVNVEVNLIVGLFAFFILNNQGILWAKRFLVDLLSGLIIPISFFPAVLQKIFAFLPFQAISYIPSNTLVKGLSIHQWLPAIGVQFVWTIILALICWGFWSKARKTLIVQGG